MSKEKYKKTLAKLRIVGDDYYNVVCSLTKICLDIKDLKEDGYFSDSFGFLVRTESLIKTVDLIRSQLQLDLTATSMELEKIEKKEAERKIKFIVGKKYTATTGGEYVVTARYGNGPDLYIVCNNNIVFKITGMNNNVEVAENEYASRLSADNKYAVDEDGQDGYINV